MSRPTIGLLFYLVICLAPGHASAAGFGFANFSAVVKADGTTIRGSGVKQSLRFATGAYLVEFTRAVNACSYLAGPSGLAGGQASVALSTANTRTLEIRTFSKAGAPANLGFVVLVSCSS